MQLLFAFAALPLLLMQPPFASAELEEYFAALGDASALAKRGDMAGAREGFAAAVASEPGAFQGYMAWGAEECLANHVKRCAKVFTEGLRRVAGVRGAEAQYTAMRQHTELELGQACYRKELPNKAVKYLRSAVKLDRDSVTALHSRYTLGQVYEKKAVLRGGGWLGNADADEALRAYAAVVRDQKVMLLLLLVVVLLVVLLLLVLLLLLLVMLLLLLTPYSSVRRHGRRDQGRRADQPGLHARAAQRAQEGGQVLARRAEAEPAARDRAAAPDRRAAVGRGRGRRRPRGAEGIH